MPQNQFRGDGKQWCHAFVSLLATEWGMGALGAEGYCLLWHWAVVRLSKILSIHFNSSFFSFSLAEGEGQDGRVTPRI